MLQISVEDERIVVSGVTAENIAAVAQAAKCSGRVSFVLLRSLHWRRRA
jgi:hypothetical protein